MHAEIEFHPEAKAELDAAFLWYSEQNVDVAAGFVKEIQESLLAISESPARWPIMIRETRRYLLRRFPYMVVYRENGGIVEVLAVAHLHRRPGYWKKRR